MVLPSDRRADSLRLVSGAVGESTKPLKTAIMSWYATW